MNLFPLVSISLAVRHLLAAARWSAVALILLLLAPSLRAQVIPGPDRIRIAEAFRVADRLSARVWAGWESAPFALLLVAADTEYLVRHPRPDSTFRRAGYDSLLGSEVYIRPRVYAPNLLATFPTGPGVPTVIMGQPEPTGRASAQWVITALHEHFHQFQMTSPGYYAAVDSLQLSHGDDSGMWMLNYPFPYQSLPVAEAFGAMAGHLLAILEGPGGDSLAARLDGYRMARRSLQELLNEEECRYFAFQLWQEGVARYVEYQVALLAARDYRPSPELEALPDYVPFSQVAASLRDDIYEGLRQPNLPADGRVELYPLGAATALALDRLVPDWKARYLAQRFDLSRDLR